LGAGGHDRAGRHGELELRHDGQQGRDRPPLSLQLPDGTRPGVRHLRQPGSAHRPDRRAEPARVLPAMGGLHGGGTLMAERPNGTEPPAIDGLDLVIDGDGHVIEVNETYERIDPQYRERRPVYTQAGRGYIVRLVDGKVWGPDTECGFVGVNG